MVPLTLFIRVASVLAISMTALCGAPPPPKPDFFRHDYGPMLPVKEGAAASLSHFPGHVVSTGDKGWLTGWVEASTGLGELRTVVRLLPPSFDSPPPAAGGSWTGNAPGAVTIGAKSFLSFDMVSGAGGALLTWVEDGRVRAWWFSQALGGPKGAPFDLSGSDTNTGHVVSAGDGQYVWTVWSTPGSQGLYRFTGAVLENVSGEIRVKARFTLPGLFQSNPRAVAAGGRCFWSHFGDTGGTARIVSANETGTVTPERLIFFPDTAYWMGIVAEDNGFWGYWADTFTQPLPQTHLIFRQEMTIDGNANPSQFILSTNSLSGILTITTGPAGKLITPYGEAPLLRVRPRQPPVQLAHNPDTGQSVHAIDDERVLALCSTPDSTRMTAERIYFGGQKPVHRAVLSSGAGQQTTPSLAWTPLGPQVVFELRNYAHPAEPNPVTGFNKLAGRPGGIAFSAGSFKSPVQARQSDGLQLIAYRRENIDGSGQPNPDDPDDVMGVLYRMATDGAITLTHAPFVIADGPGSQRGAAVDAVMAGTGFIVAWREEMKATALSPYATSVRAAYVSPDGTVSPPGGRVLGTSSGELSAVSASGSGFVAWRYPRNLPSPQPTAIRATYYDRNAPAGSALTLFSVSPPEHNAVSPQILSGSGEKTAIAWRDKESDRIFVSTGNTAGFSAARAVSPERQKTRQPALAALSADYSAAFWFDPTVSSSFEPPRLWMAVVDYDGVASVPVQVSLGWYDTETLAASGDGHGRVALATFESILDSPGINVMLVAPLVSSQGGLSFTSNNAQAQLSWDTSALFPALPDTVETATDLIQWSSAGNGATFSQAAGRSTLSVPLTEGDQRRLFRLRAALTP